MPVQRCSSSEHPGWLELRQELWPQDARVHLEEMAMQCSDPVRLCAFIACDDAGKALGFVEAAMRTDYVNGTDSSPVGFVEGLHVIASARKQGVGRSLVEAAERWARNLGCREMASDASIDNEVSHAMHRALGYLESERVVYFRKALE